MVLDLQYFLKWILLMLAGGLYGITGWTLYLVVECVEAAGQYAWLLYIASGNELPGDEYVLLLELWVPIIPPWEVYNI